MTSWHFPQDIIDVVEQHENFQRVNALGEADYIDVVTVANLMALRRWYRGFGPATGR